MTVCARRRGRHYTYYSHNHNSLDIYSLDLRARCVCVNGVVRAARPWVMESAGHAQVEAMLQTLPGVAMSSFRPQYFTGYGNNKDCEEYFFDRLVRGRRGTRPLIIVQR